MKYNYDLNAKDLSCKMSNHKDMKASLIFLSVPLRIILHTHKTNRSSVTWRNYSWYMTCTVTYISVSVGSVYTKEKKFQPHLHFKLEVILLWVELFPVYPPTQIRIWPRLWGLPYLLSSFPMIEGGPPSVKGSSHLHLCVFAKMVYEQVCNVRNCWLDELLVAEYIWKAA